MFQRILTDLERKRLKKYLAADGEREAVIRALAMRARKYVPTIKQDLAMLEELLVKYESHVRKD